METLVCNFSVLPDFISLQGIFSGLDLWALYIVSATKRTFCHQAHWETSCLSFCYEQMFPQHFGIILMHKMEKNRKSKEKDRHKFLWQRNCVWAGVDVSIFHLFYPCARFGVRQCGDSLLSHPKNSIANSSSISVGEWTQKSLWLNSNTLLAHSMNSVHLIWLCSVFLHIRWLLFVKKLRTMEHISDRLCISFLRTDKLLYSQYLKQQELHLFSSGENLERTISEVRSLKSVSLGWSQGGGRSSSLQRL